jgi:hypothetical protein
VRGQWANTWSAWVGQRDGKSGGNERSLGYFDAFDLNRCKSGAWLGRLSVSSERAAQYGRQQKQES